MHNLKLKKIKMPDMSDKMAMPSVMPMFHVDDMQMPEIKDWEVGASYKVVMEVKMKDMSQTDESVHAGFEILAYKHLKEKTMDEMSDHEFGEYQSKELAKR